MIEAFTARSGAPSLKVDGVSFHSPYDPRKEAARFVAENLGGDPPATVIVLGEGLGYVSEAAQAACPAARVIRVFYSTQVHDASAPGVPRWHPASGLPLIDFLRRELGELDAEGLRVIEWAPAAQLFPQVAREAREAVRQVAQELGGSFATIASAGRLWMRNSVCNFLGIERPLGGAPCGADRPVLIAASGPTLEDALPLIREMRAAMDVWALPSACAALQASGVAPDLVVMTDPGYYAMHHLHFDAPGCPIAMPLSAARGAWDLRPSRGGTTPTFLLAEPVFHERALLGAAGIAAPLIPPHGTVSATALELALTFTRAPVIISGLDMCSLDIRSHARPNAFDRLLQLQADRCHPHYGLWYGRSIQLHDAPLTRLNGVRATPAMRTYAGWFGAMPASRSQRIFRLLPSPVPIPGLRSLDRAGLKTLLHGFGSAPSAAPWRLLVDFPRLPQRRNKVQGILAEWRTVLADPRPLMAQINMPLALDQMPLALALPCMIEPRGLIECRKRLRVRDDAGARRAAEQILENCRRFIDALARKSLGE